MIEFIAYLLPMNYELLGTLYNKKVEIIENDPICSRNIYDGFSYSSKSKYKKNILIVCTDAIKRNHGENFSRLINETLTHEAMHIVQSCKSGGYMLPLDNNSDVETEASSVESNPQKVINLLNKYCK